MKEQRIAYLCLLPTVGVLAALLLYPFAYDVYLTLQNYTVGRPYGFVGIENYLDVLRDSTFYSSLVVTFVFSAAALIVETVLGLLMALVLNRESRLSRTAVMLLLLPLVMTPIVSATTWKNLYDPAFGFFNSILAQLHLGVVNFLGNPYLALPSLVVVDVWKWTPFMVLILVAGLKALPKEPLEAAVVDGASGLATLRYVTLPMLRPYLFVGIVFRLIELLRVFDLIIATTGGGPGVATETLNFYAFVNSFRYFHMSYGATLAVFLMLITLLIGNLAFRFMMRAGRYG